MCVTCVHMSTPHLHHISTCPHYVYTKPTHVYTLDAGNGWANYQGGYADAGYDPRHPREQWYSQQVSLASCLCAFMWRLNSLRSQQRLYSITLYTGAASLHVS